MNENLIGALVAILGALCLLGIRHLILSLGKSRRPNRSKDQNHKAVSWEGVRRKTAYRSASASRS
jgi:hypothetical protein